MNLAGKKILVLGGYGLVGMAVCRELLKRRPREIQIHSLRESETEQARGELLREAEDAGTALTTSHGDLFGLAVESDRRGAIAAQIGMLRDEQLDRFLLYRGSPTRAPRWSSTEGTPRRHAYRASTATPMLLREIEGDPRSRRGREGLSSALMPRLIVHPVR